MVCDTAGPIFVLLNPATMQFAVASVIRQSSGPMPFDVLMSGHFRASSASWWKQKKLFDPVI